MGKLIGVILVLAIVLAMLVFSIGFLYSQLPREPVDLIANGSSLEGKPAQIIDYGTTPVFSERLRFNHNQISYFIDDTCSNTRASSMREAFEIFQSTMGIISFRESFNEDADILVGCSDEFIQLGENMFAAGEGGPVNITNTSNFKTIQKGKIFLYEDQRCERPVVEIHELCHVFGFDHIQDPKNIMYNISKCDQQISQDMIDLINDLYSIKPLPDARISELVATRRSKYLDFNVTVLNEGLLAISDLGLTIVGDGKVIDTIALEAIGIGFGRTLKATNFKLPSSNINTIDFILDYNNQVEELEENNNAVQMTVGTA